MSTQRRDPDSAELARLAARNRGETDWDLWGPYLSDRAWGTVREDYSADGNAWHHFTHDDARRRAFRWNEDGLAGISDRSQYLCFGLALWNGADPILKERLFGLTGPEGNHGEDVKEAYFHLDATPSHSYLKFRYRYPQAAFPYEQLVTENRSRTADDPEFELIDTGVFAESRFFDVDVTYAKADADDILIHIEVINRGPDTAQCEVMPMLWFRNTWSWGYPSGPMGDVPGRPVMTGTAASDGYAIHADHPALGEYSLHAPGATSMLFTENETSAPTSGEPPALGKDAFHRFVVDGDNDAINPDPTGTKAAVRYQLTVAPGATESIRLRLTPTSTQATFDGFNELVDRRRVEADRFFETLHAAEATTEERRIQRAAWAGMIWSKQLYSYDVEQWLDGDPGGPETVSDRPLGRNRQWRHLNNFDIISMPDGWEYPWYAAWDLAFHAIAFAHIDTEFAKNQLELMTREWYMHPNGQIPAYEWAFGDVNPPVHAWAARKVYEIDAARRGDGDHEFLTRVFHKLLMNFTWWVNRKDEDGNNVFEGGFLGLDNISVIDRSAPLPDGGHLDQSDGTAWMAFYTLEMLTIALELARTDPVYQDLATKFFEHFLSIATAMSAADHALWDEEDGFFYDVLRFPDGTAHPLKVRSLVGLIPLLAVSLIDHDTLDAMPAFNRRMHWFLDRRPHLSGNVADLDESGRRHQHLVAILTPERLRRVLGYLLDEEEFLSPYGIRSLSRHHAEHPFELEIGGEVARIGYEPAESSSRIYGGNSNWRGPVWFPLNHLIIGALERFDDYLGDEFTVECPTGSGVEMTLSEVADELRRRLVSLFTPGPDGTRPFWGRGIEASDPLWGGELLFHEYFDGDVGTGLGAAHQTGWTGLIADILSRK